MCPCKIYYFWHAGRLWVYAPAQFTLLAGRKALGLCPCKSYCFCHNRRHWVCTHAEFITLGRPEGFGCVPMQTLLLLVEPKASGVWPCKMYCFGRTGGIGCVPMQNLLLLAGRKALGVCPCKIYFFRLNRRHWVCAHAEFIAFGRTEGIGFVPMQHLLLLTQLNALGALCAQGPAWGPGCVVGHVAARPVWCGQRQRGGHEATDTGLAYAPVSQAHGNHHIVQCFSLLHCSADHFCTTPGGCRLCFGLGHLYIGVSSHPPPSHGAG